MNPTQLVLLSATITVAIGLTINLCTTLWKTHRTSAARVRPPLRPKPTITSPQQRDSLSAAPGPPPLRGGRAQTELHGPHSPRPTTAAHDCGPATYPQPTQESP